MPPFALEVTGSEQPEVTCTGDPSEARWLVEFEPVREGALLELEGPEERRQQIPFGVVAIYPAVEYARALFPEEVVAETLPADVRPVVVRTAVDLTKDMRPDLLFVSFCCVDRSRPCVEDTCSETYQRGPEGWALVNESSPC